MFITAGKFESQTGRWFIRGFDFGSFDCCVKVQVDRRAIDDLGNLIALVIVVEDTAVEGNGAVE
jgi:hypothetical protein